MLVWKQCTGDITDRLIWRLKDSIIHLDEKGILLSETEKNLLLFFLGTRVKHEEKLFMANGNAIMAADTLLARGTQLAPGPISSLAIGFHEHFVLSP